MQSADCTAIALVRAQDDGSARHKLSRAWWDWRELAEAIGTRVQVQCGDVSVPCLGMDTPAYHALVREVTHIIHSAADLRVNAPIEELRRTNVQGMANLLDFARAVHHNHGLSRFWKVPKNSATLLPRSVKEQCHTSTNNLERSFLLC